jgi:dTDP-4-dehydrorhamnose 3,5-epimerase
MNVVATELPGVVILEPRRFRDDRGFFFESFNEARYAEAGLPARFVQDNLSYSEPGVLRGLHYQLPNAQGKLVSVLHGEVFDVTVDIRKGSPTFGKWIGVTLSFENGRQLYIPEGFAHGFLVTGDCAIFHYKCTAPYDPKSEGSIAWDDPAIGVDWPRKDVRLSPKDAAAPRLTDVADDRLFVFDGRP